jgi:hypothetical protein
MSDNNIFAQIKYSRVNESWYVRVSPEGDWIAAGNDVKRVLDEKFGPKAWDTVRFKYSDDNTGIATMQMAKIKIVGAKLVTEYT